MSRKKQISNILSEKPGTYKSNSAVPQTATGTATEPTSVLPLSEPINNDVKLNPTVINVDESKS